MALTAASFELEFCLIDSFDLAVRRFDSEVQCSIFCGVDLLHIVKGQL